MIVFIIVNATISTIVIALFSLLQSSINIIVEAYVATKEIWACSSYIDTFTSNLFGLTLFTIVVLYSSAATADCLDSYVHVVGIRM